MTVEEKMQALLEAASGVTTLVLAENIRVPGDWQDIPLPYIIHFPVSPEPTHTHDGPKALRIWQEYQVSVFAATYGEARQITDAVVAALDGLSDADTDRVALVRPPIPLEDYDGDRRLQHIACGFQVAGALT